MGEEQGGLMGDCFALVGDEAAVAGFPMGEVDGLAPTFIHILSLI